VAHVERIPEVRIHGFGRKETLGTPRPKWDNNIKAGLDEQEWVYGVDSSGSGYSKIAGSCEPLSYITF
jgi:hypothetical protein